MANKSSLDPASREGLFARWNHEYWPWYLIYLPVLPMLLWHAWRLRSLVFFTNVDPGIDMGGFFGERKSEIYARMPQGSYPATMLVRPGSSIAEAMEAMNKGQLTFPLIAKPDIGERGQGVVRLERPSDLEAFIKGFDQPTLLQELVTGDAEFGIMFSRDPITGEVNVLSLTGKRFLQVLGDGSSTVEELLRKTYRGSRQIERLRIKDHQALTEVPAVGERRVAEPIGNHCLGTMFLDASDLMTPALASAVSAVVSSTDGVFYGRLDVRSESVEDFQQGRFVVVELNGVSSEPGHIYDPARSILSCWSELLRHVRWIPRISAQLKLQGHPPASLREVLWRCEGHFSPSPFWRTIIRICAGTPPARRKPILRQAA